MATAKKAAAGKSAFSEEERAAMQEAKRERSKAGKSDGEADLKAKIAEMTGLDKQLAEGLYDLVKAHAPGLAPKTWYGMPAWAGADGKAVVFFKPALKFKERYATLGFNMGAKLDDGHMWPTSFALTGLGPAEKTAIGALLEKAAG